MGEACGEAPVTPAREMLSLVREGSKRHDDPRPSAKAHIAPTSTLSPSHDLSHTNVGGAVW